MKLEKYTKIDKRSFKSFDMSDPHRKMYVSKTSGTGSTG